ncbi:MAG: peptidoglycan editing factor PgeF [Vicinamibacteria bacterium]|nr:peptidoglycan editing factor PgeF [Vicinamibacteria bacterium]
MEDRLASRHRVASALAPQGEVYFLKQVHGAAIHGAPWQGTPAGDAGLCAQAGILVAIETADCMPILMADGAARVAAAVHAGWRGTAEGIVVAVVEALCALGAQRERLMVALGPAIGPCCYEVNQDLVDRFTAREHECGAIRRNAQGRWTFDLRAANNAQLVDAGIDVSRVFHVRACTSCENGRYYSYRRDGASTGRMASFIGWSRAAAQS